MRKLVSDNFLDLLLDAVCAVSATGEFVFVNAAFERVFGYPVDEVIGRNMMEFVHPDDRAATVAAAQRVMEGHLQLHFENRYVRKDGRIVHIRWTARWVEQAKVRVAVAHDITELQRSRALQAALHAISEAAHTAEDLISLFEEVHRTIAGLLDARHFSVMLCDEAGLSLHPAYHADPGGSPAQSIELEHAPALARLLHGEQVQPAPGQEDPHQLTAPLRAAGVAIGMLMLRSEGGYTQEDAELLHFIAGQVATAIDRKRMHVSLQALAERDQLTQLLNRRAFVERLAMAVRNAQDKSSELSVLFLDLDAFKQVNDNFGHDVGDQLLQAVADRLMATVRGVDVVARLGGDEFVVLLEQDLGGRGALLLGERIEQSFSLPFVVGEATLLVRPSVGSARFPVDALDGQQLLRLADAAMYEAKRKKATEGASVASLAVNVLPSAQAAGSGPILN